MAIQGYYLGCPAWGFKEWEGTVYRRGAPAREYLEEYARVFTAVEGSTTFYSVPSPEMVERWREATPTTFRFCFKLPQSVTHRHGLEGVGEETAGFLRRLEPLGERLGPFMVQLPPSFGPERLEVLDRFLAALPRDRRFAVELRHRAFFAAEETARRADDLLLRHGCERIILDTRALRSGDADHPEIAAARHRKPDLPVRELALGHHPLLRLIGHPEPAVNAPWLDRWQRLLGGWLAAGKVPYVFVHTPTNVHAPELARHLHHLLRRHHDLGDMPPWPGEQEDASGQLRLL